MMIWSQSDNGPVSVTASDRKNLLSDLGDRFENNQGFSVATLNLDHVVKLRRDGEFRLAYGAHSHVTADGNPIVWLSRLAGQDVSLIPGSELIEPLVALAAKHKIQIALYGSNTTSLNNASVALKEKNPDLEVAFIKAPEMGFDPNSQIAVEDMQELAASGARLCFIALGAPKQEQLAVRAQQLHPNIGFVSIGAGLNFIAGTETRAPAWVRKIAGEWIWRMVADPKRLVGRYSACLLAMPGLTLTALRTRFGKQGKPS